MADMTRTKSRELEAGPALKYDWAYNCTVLNNKVL